MSILDKFSKIFDFGPNLQKRIFLKKIRKMSILFKFWKNFDFGQNLRKKAIFFFENFEKFRFKSNFREKMDLGQIF